MRQLLFWLFVILSLVLIVVAWTTNTWVLTAVVIGLLFGFAMQRAGFCGSSILSSVVLYRDTRGILGAAIAVCVAMLGFAVLVTQGWVVPNPKPLNILPAIIGGVVFGSGMVLAGGCVSGALFKAGEGRLGAMLALIGIGIGTNMMAPGLFGPIRKAIATASPGTNIPPGLNQAMGLSYPSVALAIGAAALVVLLTIFVKQRKGGSKEDGKPLLERLITGKWSPMTAGAFIGLLGWFAYLSSAASGRDYPLGVTHGVMALFSLVVGGGTAVKWWLALEVIAIVAGSALSAWLCGELKLRSGDASTLLVALLGGVLVGAGAVLGSGCFVGNILSGWALLSLHSLLFGACAILANWGTTILYLRGIG